MDETTLVFRLLLAAALGAVMDALALLALTRLERLEKRLPHPRIEDEHQTEA